MKDESFLQLLKNTAKEQQLLVKEKFIPDQLSDLANFVASHLWQSLLTLAFFSTAILNLWKLIAYDY